MTPFMIVAYLLGVVCTAWFNLELIVGRIQYPWAVVRNALLWPVFLPIIIIILVWAVAHER
jgi:hypothetical protein